MGGFFANLGQRFRQFMQGRYGTDNLFRFMYGLALIMWIISAFLQHNLWFLNLLPAVILLLCLFRMFSKNIQARYNENTRYLMLKSKVLGLFGRKGPGNDRGGSAKGSTTDPNYKIFNCPACRQKARVPKGRGKIEITCPKCGNHFKRRT